MAAGSPRRASRLRARQSMRCWSRSASRWSRPAVPAVRHFVGRWIRYAENARLLLTTTAEEQDPASSREPKGRNDHRAWRYL